MFVFAEPAGLFETISCVLRTALGLLIFLSVATTTFNLFGARHKPRAAGTAVPLYWPGGLRVPGDLSRHIHRIRQAIETHLHQPRILVHRRGVGYYLETGRP